ncbi:MAG TPA: DNA ligase D [Pseudobdellovibrionaceae bacterium]|jgi:bifunctional non-homologous end joining protein LigD
MSLREYRKKRDFSKTKEPLTGKRTAKPPIFKAPIFVVQEHHTRHLHYDFRLEAFGTLKSWAVPKGPPMEVGEKRLAVEVEDHPLEYAKFKGRIPEGQYGAGLVKIWDRGTWIPPQHLRKELKNGHLEFELKGKRLRGRWLLQRTKNRSGRKNQWLLIKRHDKAKLTDKLRGEPAPLPIQLAPELATLVAAVPRGDEWLHEIKFDGYRTLAILNKGKVELQSRRGLDWTEKYRPLDKEIKKLKVQSGIFDGEIVVLDEDGRSSFSSLQEALKVLNKDVKGNELIYYLFDILYVNGRNLCEEPLEVRKMILKKILLSSSVKNIRYSEHIRGQGEEIFVQSCKSGFEGIVSKNRTKSYRMKRTTDWLKLKCSHRQEFVIGGYTDPTGTRESFGALLLGVYESDQRKDKLRYVGRVGTGFDSKMLSDLFPQLQKLRIATSPFEVASPKKTKNTHWVQPSLVAEIEFKAWTHQNILRQASFIALRADKSPKEITKETPLVLKKKAQSARKGSFRITHPERVLYPASQVTKLDVARYYKSAAPWILEYVSKRPMSLLRCPTDVTSGCFFQKHVTHSNLTAVDEGVVEDQSFLFINSEEGLLQLVQSGVLEFHTWQCSVTDPEKPNQVVFDLDPDEDVPWREVVKTAFRFKQLLSKISLKSFVKLTGGKGLHVHIPIAPLYSWDEVKAFAKAIAYQLKSEHPDFYTLNMAKKKRSGKIFLDYLRNGLGATAIAPYSLRAREEPFVALPLSWPELKNMKRLKKFDMNIALMHLASARANPWPRYNQLEQRVRLLEV